MIPNRFEIQAEVWRYPGAGGWHFITLPRDQSEVITKAFRAIKQGWGSLPVTVTVGKTAWKTSIFPDSKSGSYVLPLKAQMRKKERIEAGDTISILMEIMV